jgi:hypothetical protein
MIGVKETGKTKALINMVNTAVDNSHGDVVCIEKGNKLRYDVKYQARLIDTNEYFITDAQSLYGFVAGILASNHDVTDLFIDSALKICNEDRVAFEKLLDELVAAGLDGIEVYTPEMSDEDKARFIKYAKKNKILTTGGSNFKGLYNKHILSVGDCDLPDECIQEMNTYKARKKKLERKKAQESK